VTADSFVIEGVNELKDATIPLLSQESDGWFLSKPCKQKFWNHPACSAFSGI